MAREHGLTAEEVRQARRANLDILSNLAHLHNPRQYSRTAGKDRYKSFCEVQALASDRANPRLVGLKTVCLAVKKYVASRLHTADPLILVSCALQDDLAPDSDGKLPDFGLAEPWIACRPPVPGNNVGVRVKSPTALMLEKAVAQMDRDRESHLQIGLHVAKGCKSSQKRHAELLYIFEQADDSGQRSNRIFTAFEAHSEHRSILTRWNESLGDSDRITAYFDGFSAFPDAHLIQCISSATSIFRHLHNSGKLAAAQIAVALTGCDDAEALYEYLQLILCGLPAAWSAITTLSDQAVAFRKYHDLFARLQTPLRSVTESVRRVQEETQLISTILYHPEEAIFASRSLVSDIFDDGRKVTVGGYTLVLRHELYDSGDEARLAFGVLLLTVLNGSMPSASDDVQTINAAINFVIDRIRAILADDNDQMLRIAADLAFIANFEEPPQLNASSSVQALFPDPPTDSALFRSRENTRLQAMKQVLFEPLKLETREWRPRPLAYVLRAAGVLTAELKDELRKTRAWIMEPDWTPLSYAATLTFLMEVLRECATRGSDPRFAIREDHDGRRLEFAIEANPYSTDPDGLESLKRMLNRRIRAGLDSLPSGDWSRPYVNLSRRLIGVRAVHAGPKEAFGWMHDEATDANVLLRLTTSKREFSIVANAQSIALQWFPI